MVSVQNDPMIDSKKLAELRTGHQLCGNECCLRFEFIDDIEALWKVAKAADTFVNGEWISPNFQKLKQALATLRQGEEK